MKGVCVLLPAGSRESTSRAVLQGPYSPPATATTVRVRLRIDSQRATFVPIARPKCDCFRGSVSETGIVRQFCETLEEVAKCLRPLPAKTAERLNLEDVAKCWSQRRHRMQADQSDRSNPNLNPQDGVGNYAGLARPSKGLMIILPSPRRIESLRGFAVETVEHVTVGVEGRTD